MKFAKVAFVAALSLSAQAFAGSACFYEHANFVGRSFCLRDGEQVSSVRRSFGMNDVISSIRADRGTTIELYEDDNFSGARTTVDGTVYALSGFWNDRVSSIVVRDDYGRGGRDDRGGYDRPGRGDDRGGYDRPGRGGRDDRGHDRPGRGRGPGRW